MPHEQSAVYLLVFYTSGGDQVNGSDSMIIANSHDEAIDLALHLPDWPAGAAYVAVEHQITVYRKPI